jgi:hypothetical protein
MIQYLVCRFIGYVGLQICFPNECLWNQSSEGLKFNIVPCNSSEGLKFNIVPCNSSEGLKFNIVPCNSETYLNWTSEGRNDLFRINRCLEWTGSTKYEIFQCWELIYKGFQYVLDFIMFWGLGLLYGVLTPFSTIF